MRRAQSRRKASARAATNAEGADALEMVSAIGGPLWRHPSAFYFGGIDVFAHSISRPLEFPPNTVWRYRNSDPLTIAYLTKLAVAKRGENILTKQRTPALSNAALLDQLQVQRFELPRELGAARAVELVRETQHVFLSHPRQRLPMCVQVHGGMRIAPPPRFQRATTVRAAHVATPRRPITDL